MDFDAGVLRGFGILIFIGLLVWAGISQKPSE